MNDLLLAALRALQAQETADLEHSNCPDCEGLDDWAKCGRCSEFYGTAIELRREALSRSQPSPARGVEAVRVKTLEFEQLSPPTEDVFEAYTPFGCYRVWGVRSFWYWDFDGGTTRTACASKSLAIAAAQADYASCILSALEPAPARADAGTAATHRHKKRGTEYVLIGFGKMQAEKWKAPTIQPDEDGQNRWTHVSIDMRTVAIYRSVADGSLWVRPREEFEDGRFEPINPDTGRGK